MKIKDQIGEFELSYEQMKTYHGGSFFGGVALAYKMLEACIDLTTQNKVLSRDEIVFITALNAPGIIDGIEYITRANTKNRIIINTNLNKKAPKGPNGFYFFVIKHNKKKIKFTLKDKLLPEDFTYIASKCKVGINSSEEFDKWTSYKKAIEQKVINSKYDEVFDLELSDCE